MLCWSPNAMPQLLRPRAVLQPRHGGEPRQDHGEALQMSGGLGEAVIHHYVLHC